MRKISRIFLIIVLTFCLYFTNLSLVNAQRYGVTIASGGLNVRKGPGTNYSSVATLAIGTSVNLVSENLVKAENGCTAGWYHIYYNSTNTGYVCSTYLTLYDATVSTDDRKAETEYEKYLEAQGFPSTYWDSLTLLHEKYPNWTFKAEKTGLDWNASVAAESAVGMSFIQTANEGWRSTASNSYDWLSNTWTVMEGSNWYAADSRVVAYYMDPRNFLTENKIFMFEQLGYDANTQNEAAVSAIFGTSSYLNSYVSTFIEAGKKYSVSPVYLASRVRQEVGLNVGAATSGAVFTYEGKTYSGLYNVYNIGASTAANPVLKGLVWANGGSDGSATSYNRPWTSIEKSILGGADYIAAGYISKGQDTLYFQRFNVSSYSSYSKYSHQYMTNIQAVNSESTTVYNTYNTNEMLSVAFEFVIPVYNNMPNEVSKLPNTGNPNNHLSNLRVNDNALNGFAHDINEYTYYINSSATSVTINATPIVNSATVSNNGNIALTDVTTKIEVNVTAANGDIYIYTINVVKTDSEAMSANDVINNMPIKSDGTYMNGIEVGTTIATLTSMAQKASPIATVLVKNSSGSVKTSGELATGDIITITNNNSTKTLTLVIYGDSSGDGKINAQDLLVIQKHILGVTTQTGAKLKAVDANNNGSVNAQDLLAVQKHILGVAKLS